MNSSAFSFSHFARLCRKDLRETLRDRRTITTLLLMPILVYPLLALAMNRLLLSAGGHGPEGFIVGVASVTEGQILQDTIVFSKQIEGQIEDRPIRIESLPVDEGGNPLEEVTQSDSDHDHRGEQVFDIRLVETDMKEALKSGEIDLAVSVEQLESVASELPRFKFNVDFRPTNPISRSATNALAERLRILNDFDRFRDPEQIAMVRMQANPLDSADDTGASAIAVIPLVLLLMTITGAVYPSIDLTAGERERGTMEALIASPIAKHLLLLAKYVAVVCVAMLTALANLSAMWVTLWVTGIDKIFIGGDGLSPTALLKVLPLLFLFAGFFSAVLLALCSFAKSFKEAQALLIPAMLLSLGPGIVALLPGIEFNVYLALIPLINIILLSRDLLIGTAEFLPSVVAISCTLAYTLAMITVATKLFGYDATSRGSDGGWSDMFARESRVLEFSDATIFFAGLFPLYFIASNVVPKLMGEDIQRNAWGNAVVTSVLFLAMPIAYLMLNKLPVANSLRIPLVRIRVWAAVVAVVLLGLSTWVFAHESFVIAKAIGLATLSEEQIANAEALKAKFQEVPLWIVITTMAIIPAVCEEAFFRGFLLSCLRRWSLPKQILLSALIFGAFHLIGGSVLALERFFPTFLLGLVLGLVAVRTGTIWYGVIVHAIHNGAMFTLVHYEEQIKAAGFDLADSEHLPLMWIGAATLSVAIGIGLAWIAYLKPRSTSTNSSQISGNGTDR